VSDIEAVMGFGRKREATPPEIAEVSAREASGEPGGEPRGAWCEAWKSSRLVRGRGRAVRG